MELSIYTSRKRLDVKVDKATDEREDNIHKDLCWLELRTEGGGVTVFFDEVTDLSKFAEELKVKADKLYDRVIG